MITLPPYYHGWVKLSSSVCHRLGRIRGNAVYGVGTACLLAWMKCTAHSHTPCAVLLGRPKIMVTCMLPCSIHPRKLSYLPYQMLIYIPILVYVIELHTVYQRTRQSWRDFFNFWRRNLDFRSAEREISSHLSTEKAFVKRQDRKPEVFFSKGSKKILSDFY